MRSNMKTLKICLGILCLLPDLAIGTPQSIGANFFMKTITINSPKHGIFYAFVDDEDFDYISKYTWRVNKAGNYSRPVTNIKRKSTKMHHLLIERNGLTIDHIDGNPFNNQRNNLRVCSQSQNTKNCKSHSDSKTGIKGVFFNNNKNKFEARIKVNGKAIFLKRSNNIIDCINAYNEAAKKYFGEFARLNEIPNG